MRTPGTAAELERRRRLAVHRLQEGWKPNAVSQFLEVHIRTVRYWWAAYKRHGDAGLNSKPQPGRPSKLTGRQVRVVLSWFRKNPRSFGFATELWTARRDRKSTRLNSSHSQISYAVFCLKKKKKKKIILISLKIKQKKKSN